MKARQTTLPCSGARGELPALHWAGLIEPSPAYAAEWTVGKFRAFRTIAASGPDSQHLGGLGNLLTDPPGHVQDRLGGSRSGSLKPTC
eukprot:6507694-Pyramimonas_sp.AAC.1